MNIRTSLGNKTFLAMNYVTGPKTLVGSQTLALLTP